MKSLRQWLATEFPAPASGCGRGGMCHKSPDCSDAYCPGRAESSYLHLQEPSEPEPAQPAEQRPSRLYTCGVWAALVVVTCFLGYALSTLDLPDLAFLIR